jgi:hypothetical protein
MKEVSLFNTAIPAHLRNGGDDLTRSMMGSSGSKRISIRGSVFRMVVDGQEVAKNEDRAMNVVIVNAAANNSRTYYSGTYVEGQNSSPACWSNDGVTPDPRSENIQSTKCETCPMNVAGSGQGTSKACRYSRRLAVALGNDLENSDVYQLVLPAQSIFGKGETNKLPLQAYVNFLVSHGVSIRGVVTEMRFDTNSATPKLTFRAVDFLNEDQYNLAIEKGESAEAVNAITYNPAPSSAPKLAMAIPKAAAPAPAAPAPAAPVVREKKAAPAPADLSSVLEEWGDDE